MKKLISSVLTIIFISISFGFTQYKKNSDFGTIQIPDGITIVVKDSNNKQITLEPSEEIHQLSVGKYCIDSWSIEREDENGNPWKLRGTGFGNKGKFTIISDQVVKLSIGETIVPSLIVRKEKSTYYISHYLKGQLSETIEITKNGSRPDAPQLHIRNEDGSYQETLTFKYG